ncbi:unnamed protein product [Sphagnum balticum]
MQLAQPGYSVPQYHPEKAQENPSRIDEGSSLDYKPKYHVPKPRQVDYSFGYFLERDYSTEAPPPNNYEAKLPTRRDFNK